MSHDQVLRLVYEAENANHLFGSVEGNAAVYNPAETLQQNRANYNIRRPMGPATRGSRWAAMWASPTLNR
ncbi:MAG TPA: hypothetical protein VGR96_06210 [Acidobacteriaceae bacterium]|nr:hypothetical protein [Acidobacteriaceae bacterium]